MSNKKTESESTESVNLVEIWHVFSRMRKGQHIEYALGTNLQHMPHGYRRIYGSGAMALVPGQAPPKVLDSLLLCKENKFFKLKSRERRDRSKIYRSQQEAIAKAFKTSKHKIGFDWTKIRRLTRDF